jgi:hypothetical protein
VSRNSLDRLRKTAWLVAHLLLPASLALADSGRINPRPAQTFRGWGMSLAWEANDECRKSGIPRVFKKSARDLNSSVHLVYE